MPYEIVQDEIIDANDIVDPSALEDGE